MNALHASLGAPWLVNIVRPMLSVISDLAKRLDQLCSVDIEGPCGPASAPPWHLVQWLTHALMHQCSLSFTHRADLLQLLWRLWRLSQDAPPDQPRWSAMALSHFIGLTHKHVGNP